MVLSPTEVNPPLSAGSFDALYREHAAHVHRFCLSQAGSTAAAEDLTHETFLRAMGVDSHRRPEATAQRAWLIRIARNLTSDQHRRRSRWLGVFERMRRAPEHVSSIEATVEQRDQLQHVHAQLGRMRPRERELIGLRVAADLSYREIGDLLGIAEATAKVATNRALNRLRSRLEDSP